MDKCTSGTSRDTFYEAESNKETDCTDMLLSLTAPRGLAPNPSTNSLDACMLPTPPSLSRPASTDKALDLTPPSSEPPTAEDPETVYYVGPSTSNSDQRSAAEAQLCWGAMLKNGGVHVECTTGFSLCTKPHPKLKDHFCQKCQNGIDVPVGRVRALADNANGTSKNKHSTGFWKTWKASDDDKGEDPRVVNHTRFCDGPSLVIFPHKPQNEQGWADIPDEWIRNGVIRFVIAKDTLVPAAQMHNKKSRETNSHPSPIQSNPPAVPITSAEAAALLASRLLASYQEVTAIVAQSLERVTAKGGLMASQDKAKLCAQLTCAQSVISAMQSALS